MAGYDKEIAAAGIDEGAELSAIWDRIRKLNEELTDLTARRDKGQKVDNDRIALLEEETERLREDAIERGNRRKQDTREKRALEIESLRLDPFYAEDMYMLAKFAMVGDWMKAFTKIADINQGLKANKWEMMNYIHNLEVMTGMEFDTLMQHVESIDRSGTPPKEYMKILPSRKERVEASQRFQRFQLQNNAWMDYELDNGKALDSGDFKMLNYKEQFHYIGDALAAVLSLPDLMGNLKALKVQKETMERAFVTGHPTIDRFIHSFAERIGLDQLYKNQYNTLTNEVYNWMIDKFLNESPWWEEGTITPDGKTMTMMTAAGGVSVHHDPRTPAGRFRFAYEFPEYFFGQIRDLKGRNPEFKDNYFVKNLVINPRNDMPTLEIVNSYRVDDHVLDDLRAGYELLPRYLKDQLSLYQIVTGGFRYGKGSFEKVIDVKMYQAFTDWIDGHFINKLEKDNDYSIERDLEQNFLMNILANPSFNMARYGRHDQDIENIKYSHVKYPYHETHEGPWLTPFYVLRKVEEVVEEGVIKPIARFFKNRYTRWVNSYSSKKSTYVETGIAPGTRSHTIAAMGEAICYRR
jgi:hypothetical protein